MDLPFLGSCTQEGKPACNAAYPVASDQEAELLGWSPNPGNAFALIATRWQSTFARSVFLPIRAMAQ